MADSGGWYGEHGGDGGAKWGGGKATYTIGPPKRHADPAAKAKRLAARKAKSKAARKARRKNRG